MICQKCGAENADYATYCHSCGAVIKEGGTACLKCGELIPVGMSSCGHCGTSTPAAPVGIAKERPGIVKFITVVNLIAVAISTISLAVLMFVGPLPFDIQFDLFGWTIAVSALFAALSTTLIFALWDLKNWARVTFIVLYVIGLLGFPVGTIVSGIILYYLSKPDTKEAFASVGRPEEPGGQFNWRIPLYCIGALLAFGLVNIGLVFISRQLQETTEWIWRLRFFVAVTLSGLAVGVALAPYFELRRTRYLLPAIGTLVMLLIGVLGALPLATIIPQSHCLLGATYGALVGFTLRDKKRALPMSLYAIVATSVGNGLADLASRALYESSTWWLAQLVYGAILALAGGGLLGLLFALPKEKRIPVTEAIGG